jgi:glycosyltransferase involved in cell wall biosynthesis
MAAPSVRSGPPGKDAPRVTVIRGTYTANIPELGVYAGLASHGFRPELLGARRTSYADEEVGMPVRRLPTPYLAGRISSTMVGGYLVGKVSPYRYFSEYLLGFDRAVRESDVLIPADLGHPTSYQAILQRPRAKVVVQVWDNIPFNWPEDRPLASHYRAVLEQADYFLPFTADADRTLRLQGVPAQKRSRISPGIDVERFRPPSPEERAAARARWGLAPEEVAVAFVGRVEFYKGILTLIEALVDADRRIRVRVFGRGKMLPVALARARNLGVEARVRFEGPVPHDRLLEQVLWAADVVAVPSIPTEQWREQFGQVYLEAMAAGVPVLATWSGAIPEVVLDGATGILVPPDMPTELTRALDRLAGDPALRRRMGDEGRKRTLALFDVRAQSSALAEILRKAVLPVPSR